LKTRTDGWRRKARLAALILTLGAGLAGCAAVPPAVKVASLAANGLSYAATGKGTTDHVISAAAERDCALLRGLDDKPVCQDAGEVKTADAEAARPASRAPAPAPVPAMMPLDPGAVRAIMAAHTRAFVIGNK